MCGRLVNIDTVARVLADYYHLKTGTQLAALDEALSKVPAVSVGGGHGKDHVADPGKMVGDLISRSAVLDEIHKYMEERDYTIGTLYDNICELLSVRQWIPCSERLPEEEKVYLVTFANEKVGMSSWHKDTLYNQGFDAYLTGVTEDGWCEYFGVIAWMEKPEPWKGGKE